MLDNETLKQIKEACREGKSERQIKDEFGLTDYDYRQARKILSVWGGDYE